MKKLFVTYDDGYKLTYTMKDSVSYEQYFERHKDSIGVASIVLQQYPKKNNEPIKLL